jgi:hypothetical protein
MYKEKRLILLIVLKVESPTLGSPKKKKKHKKRAAGIYFS